MLRKLEGGDVPSSIPRDPTLVPQPGERRADDRQNPYTLVHDGAITKNEPGKVNIHPVTYKLAGLDICANVYTSANDDPAKKAPGVAVAHPNGGVKEQTAGLYGQRLAERGYVTIVADAAFQGASGGQPRCVDKPAYRTEDIHGMSDFIGQYPGVDAARLALFGICGGGGYALNAAKTDKRFKAIATLSRQLRHRSIDIFGGSRGWADRASFTKLRCFATTRRDRARSVASCTSTWTG